MRLGEFHGFCGVLRRVRTHDDRATLLRMWNPELKPLLDQVCSHPCGWCSTWVLSCCVSVCSNWHMNTDRVLPQPRGSSYLFP